MKIVSAEEMKKIDSITIGEIGIPGEVLMGNAGMIVTEYISGIFSRSSKVCIFSGQGNNGGDGFVAGFLLRNRGFEVDIFTAGRFKAISKTSRVFFRACKKSGLPLYPINTERNVKKINLSKYDLIIDALTGTGFKGAPRGIVKELISLINKSGKTIVSIDIPSGLPSNGEAPEGEAVHADHTVTIGLPKISLVTYPGKKYTGKLHVADIGFPKELTESPEIKRNLIDAVYAAAKLRRNPDPDAHKGSSGSLLLVGGFDGMEGAIMLAAKAAFETGAGLVTLLTTENARSIIAGKIPEMITSSLLNIDSLHNEIVREITDGLTGEDSKKAKLGEMAGHLISTWFTENRKFDAIVIGPGIGRTSLSSVVFNAIIDYTGEHGPHRILIDGDGLYHLADYIKRKNLPAGAIITPHFLEASRLLGVPVEEIKKNRLKAAMDLTMNTGATVLLKGPSSIITDGSKTLINTTGNPALATAGSGDVLSGIIASMLLRGLDHPDAAGIGAYIHGLSADLHMKEFGTDTMKATDILSFIKKAVKSAT
jgi:ADP-dependent NAD(P)H-hydrate dehydratase / NAD(P)H-hydrate epimerase